MNTRKIVKNLIAYKSPPPSDSFSDDEKDKQKQLLEKLHKINDTLESVNLDNKTIIENSKKTCCCRLL